MALDIRTLGLGQAAPAADPSAPKCHDCGNALKHADEVRHNGGYCYSCGPGSAKWQAAAPAPRFAPAAPRAMATAPAARFAGGAGQLAPDLAAAIAQLANAAAAHGLRALVEFSPARPTAPAPARPTYGAGVAPMVEPAPDLGAMPSTDCPACFVLALGHTVTDEPHTCGRPAASVAPDGAGAASDAAEPAAATSEPAAAAAPPAPNGAH